MVKWSLIISAFLILSASISCTGGKKIVGSNAANEELSAEEALRRVEGAFLDFNQLNSNAELYIKNKMFTGTVNTKIRMVKDSVIWMSASKLGFEVGRVLITQDSVFVMERLQKTYIKESMEGISEMAGLAVSYQFIEDFLVGNPYIDKEINEVTYISSDTMQVKPSLNDLKITHLIDNKDYKLLKTSVVDDKTKVYGDMDFQDYRAITENQIFSYFRNVKLDAGEDEDLELSIKFNNPEINIEKSIKFSIPDSYSVRKF